MKNAMEAVAGGFQFDLPEVDGYEEDFLLRKFSFEKGD